MALGKVVLVTEPDGAPDYMEQGVSGFYVNHGDAERLRQTIVMVMENADLRKRVGEAARARAWKEFSPEVFRRRILSLLKEDKEGMSMPVSAPTRIDSPG
jgi:glycosyltransferase involved in cell wall biosynthesis